MHCFVVCVALANYLSINWESSTSEEVVMECRKRLFSPFTIIPRSVFGFSLQRRCDDIYHEMTYYFSNKEA